MSRAIVLFSFLVILLLYGFLKGVDLLQLLNIQSLIIVFGGIALVLLLGFPKELIIDTYKNIIRSIKRPYSHDYESDLIKQILYLARIYRTKGPLALEKEAKKIRHSFLKYGAILVAEGYDTLPLISALEREHNLLDKKAYSQIKLLRALSSLAPALGMAGTVISLMQVMQHIEIKGSLGASLGLALSSTLYGLVIANLFILPLSLKLQQYFERESSARLMLIDALVGLQQGEHPLRIAERLNSYDLYCKIRKEEKRYKNIVSIRKDKLARA